MKRGSGREKKANFNLRTYDSEMKNMQILGGGVR